MGFYEMLLAMKLNGGGESKTVTSISAVFTQGTATIYDTDSLDDLKQYLVVTATYSDSTSEAVNGYTLSGTLTAGTSTITVTYSGKTTTFSVTVTAGGDPNLLYSIENATINNDYIDTAINLYAVDKDFTIAFDADITTISSGPRFIDGLESVSPYQGINIALANGNHTQFSARLFNQYKITSITSVAGYRLRFVCTHTTGSNKMTTKYRVGTGSANSNEVIGATWNASNTSTINIGSPSSSTNFDWSGTVNSCYIYDRVLSSAEINDYLGV